MQLMQESSSEADGRERCRRARDVCTHKVGGSLAVVSLTAILAVARSSGGLEVAWDCSGCHCDV